MKKINITMICLFTMMNMALAQTTNVEVMDISAKYYELPTDTAKIVIRIGCNIKQIDKASKLHLLLGTAANTGDGLTDVADIAQQNNEYVVNYAGNTFPVHGYKTHLQFIMDKTQLNNCQYVTIYVEDTGGNNTPHLNATLF